MKSKCKLGDIITQRREKFSGEMLSICGVTREGFIPPKQKDADVSLYNVFYKNDFVFNPARMELNSIVFNDIYDKAMCSSLYEIFYVNRTDLVLPEFLALIVKQDWFTRCCDFLGSGSAREYCRIDNISQIEIEYPSIQEQQKIINKYKIIKNRIALKKQINDNLLSQAQTYFNLIFSDKDVEKLLPQGWKVAKVGDYCVDNIANLSKTDTFETILYLDTGSITSNYIVELQKLNLLTDEIPSRAKRKATHGDIIYSTVRPNLRHYGLLQNPPENLIVSTGFAVLHNKRLEVTNELLFMWLTNESILGYLQAIAENSVSTYPSLNVSDLMNVKIIVPDTDTLERITSLLSSVFTAISENNRQVQMLKRSLDTLLPKLLSSR